MKTTLLILASLTVGAAAQRWEDSVFVMDAFHSSAWNLSENVMQGAALLDLTSNDLRACTNALGAK